MSGCDKRKQISTHEHTYIDHNVIDVPWFYAGTLKSSQFSSQRRVDNYDWAVAFHAVPVFCHCSMLCSLWFRSTSSHTRVLVFARVAWLPPLLCALPAYLVCPLHPVLPIWPFLLICNSGFVHLPPNVVFNEFLCMNCHQHPTVIQPEFCLWDLRVCMWPLCYFTFKCHHAV